MADETIKISELDPATELLGDIIQEHPTQGTQKVDKSLVDGNIDSRIDTKIITKIDKPILNTESITTGQYKKLCGIRLDYATIASKVPNVGDKYMYEAFVQVATSSSFVLGYPYFKIGIEFNRLTEDGIYFGIVRVDMFGGEADYFSVKQFRYNHMNSPVATPEDETILQKDPIYTTEYNLTSSCVYEYNIYTEINEDVWTRKIYESIDNSIAYDSDITTSVYSLQGREYYTYVPRFYNSTFSTSMYKQSSFYGLDLYNDLSLNYTNPLIKLLTNSSGFNIGYNDTDKNLVIQKNITGTTTDIVSINRDSGDIDVHDNQIVGLAPATVSGGAVEYSQLFGNENISSGSGYSKLFGLKFDYYKLAQLIPNNGDTLTYNIKLDLYIDPITYERVPFSYSIEFKRVYIPNEEYETYTQDYISSGMNYSEIFSNRSDFLYHKQIYNNINNGIFPNQGTITSGENTSYLLPQYNSNLTDTESNVEIEFYSISNSYGLNQVVQKKTELSTIELDFDVYTIETKYETDINNLGVTNSGYTVCRRLPSDNITYYEAFPSIWSSAINIGYSLFSNGGFLIHTNNSNSIELTNSDISCAGIGGIDIGMNFNELSGTTSQRFNIRVGNDLNYNHTYVHYSSMIGHYINNYIKTSHIIGNYAQIGSNSNVLFAIGDGDSTEWNNLSDTTIDYGLIFSVDGNGRTYSTSANFSSLPTDATGLKSGDLYTQTATELGGSGTQKVICIV